MLDLQRASMWKRISAALFDFILLAIVVTGVALLLSAALGYSAQSERLDKIYDDYKQSYGLDVPKEVYDAYTDEERAAYDKAYAEANQALAADAEAGRLYVLLFNYSLIIISFSVLIGYLLLEFLVPSLLKNGQTLGKKIFGIGVMRIDGVKISGIQLFVRTVLGKYAVETMIPAFIVIMIFYNMAGIVHLAVLAVLLIAQVALMLSHRTRAPIHDKLASTVTVDIASQMIFDSPEALLAYKQKLHNEAVEKNEDDGRFLPS